MELSQGIVKFRLITFFLLLFKAVNLVHDDNESYIFGNQSGQHMPGISKIH